MTERVGAKANVVGPAQMALPATQMGSAPHLTGGQTSTILVTERVGAEACVEGLAQKPGASDLNIDLRRSDMNPSLKESDLLLSSSRFERKIQAPGSQSGKKSEMSCQKIREPREIAINSEESGRSRGANRDLEIRGLTQAEREREERGILMISSLQESNKNFLGRGLEDHVPLGAKSRRGNLDLPFEEREGDQEEADPQTADIGNPRETNWLQEERKKRKAGSDLSEESGRRNESSTQNQAPEAVNQGEKAGSAMRGPKETDFERETALVEEE